MQTNQDPNQPASHDAGQDSTTVAARTAQVAECNDIGPSGWVQTLPVFLALLQDGTPDGKRQAREHLRRMAQVADLGVLAVQRLDQLNDATFLSTQLATAGLGSNDAMSHACQAEQDQLRSPTPTQAADAAPARTAALLASRAMKRPVLLEICYSACGFYLGTYMDSEPFTRESVEYWSTREAAQAALASGLWTQRQGV